jgi:hypothetical protein
MGRTLALVFVLATVWWLVRPSGDSPDPVPGVRILFDPLQEETDEPAWKHKGVLIQPLARYLIRARVLSTKRYRFDATADVSPVDLALGWGLMSDTAVLRHVKVSQSGRWYQFYAEADAPASIRHISLHSANVHCLPADDGVLRDLLRLRVNDFVELDGFLVEVLQKGRSPWRSSLTRTDTGNGSCEIFWVESVRMLDPGDPNL